MPEFDVLQLKTPLFGAKILEASAGTGKTFAIEHLFVRLLLEAPSSEEPLPLEQILAITFTRAAAREMRMRIRSNIEKALAQLKGEISWPYLRPHARSTIARRRLEDALIGFDRAQIFTIHGFCQRLLTHYALEARVSIHPDSGESFRQAIQPRLLDFLEQQRILCPEQLGRLLSKKRSIDNLCDAILNASCPSSGTSFADDQLAFHQTIRRCPHLCPNIETLREDFARIKPNYKTTDFKGADFDEQMVHLASLFSRSDDPISLRRLLFCRGSLFSFLSPANRKLRVKDVEGSPCLAWCSDHLGMLIEQFLDPKRLLNNLRFAWQKEFEGWMEEKGLFSPDFLLMRMKESLDDPRFLLCIQQQYRAAIVDEFQDTDAVQWDIFRRIFFENKRLFYLVGDPKQSIYRFRQADLYTYFQARKSLGERSHYSLDTNYRSTSEMISALNDLFGDEQVRPWLWLPRENRSESYRPVKAGSAQRWDPCDGKKPLQFFFANDLGESAFAYIAQEIEHLKPRVAGYGSFAILVKDRMQAFAIQTFLQGRSLPCWAKSQSPLGLCPAFHALEELFEAIYFPRDVSRLKIFLSGPFVSIPAAELVEEPLFLPQLVEWKALLEQDGLGALFRVFLSACLNGMSVYERIKQRGAAFFSDTFQLIEQLLSIRSVSLETFKRFFRELEAADPDEESAARRRMDNDAEAIQILTMHASKGLEFDVVFVLGAASKTPREEDDREEAEAEKMRQLYVALTRARLRLYLPLVPPTRTLEGAESPIDLFWRRSKIGQDPLEIVTQLIEKNANIGLEMKPPIHSSISSVPCLSTLVPPPPFDPVYSHRRIFSYSALTQGETGSAIWMPIHRPDEITIHTLPRGSETGIVLHRIFDRILAKGDTVQTAVQEEIHLSPLQTWFAPIREMVEQVISLPILDGGGALGDVSEKKGEVEFFFAHSPHCFKGFIDLVFIWKGRLYFLDWKTNWLGVDDSCYAEDLLRQAMKEGDYWFQASLYAEAIQRAWPQIPFGGALYVFLRGIHASQHGTLSFQPSPVSLDQRVWKQ
jgi:exodeoxyribonuclease V beta subunit